ncbi:TPA: hypothetical protein U2Q68_004442 [Citrobacter amalonaticus]|nr:hypothetical protein [Citrobacter amalonaticus]
MSVTKTGKGTPSLTAFSWFIVDGVEDMTVTSINSAQQRHKDREMLNDIDIALQTNEETRQRLEAMRREVINRLGINKPTGDDAA